VAERRFVTIDGNEATSSIAHLCNEVMAIYPITPSSNMGELTDAGLRPERRTFSVRFPMWWRCRVKRAPPAPFTARCKLGL